MDERTILLIAGAVLLGLWLAAKCQVSRIRKRGYFKLGEELPRFLK